MNNSQTKSHQALLKILNNIGFIGAILAGISDIIFVIIFVVGISINIEMSSMILFSVVNAVIGLLINILLRYQGIKYAEIENQELCNKYYEKNIEKNKKHLSIETWQILQGLKDFLLKGIIATFSIFGFIYISIQGSKNPVQILLTIVNLILFGCFGLISMNSSYYRFYNVQIPLMKKTIEKKEIKEDVAN